MYGEPCRVCGARPSKFGANMREIKISDDEYLVIFVPDGRSGFVPRKLTSQDLQEQG